MLTSACVADGPTTGTEAVTDGGSFVVRWAADPAIAVAETWTLRVTVHDADDRDALITDVDAVTVDAAMPDHGHGMPVEPEVNAGGDGAWLAAPMQFQMPGDWELAIGVSRDGVSEQAVFAVPCCDGAAAGDPMGM